MGRLSRSRLTTLVAGVALVAALGTAVVAAGGSADEGRNLGDVRAATDPFHNLDVALSAGYEEFYVCTDKTGTGGMGQHYVKGALVADPALDTLRPEVLVYEPRVGGGLRLVAMEYVVIKADWHAANGAAPPRLFGHRLTLVPAGNRYGLPDFYEIHVWLWKPNPRGLFDDWNPRVSCLGHGDPA
jgi:hypothetical protein